MSKKYLQLNIDYCILMNEYEKITIDVKTK